MKEENEGEKQKIGREEAAGEEENEELNRRRRRIRVKGRRERGYRGR
jgi:hypothetical protein